MLHIITEAAVISLSAEGEEVVQAHHDVCGGEQETVAIKCPVT